MSKTDSKVCGQCGSTDFNNSGQCRPCQKARSAKYYAANTEKSRTQNREWLRVNAEKAAAAGRDWVQANPEKVIAAKAKWALENPGKRRASLAKYEAENPEVVKASGLKYRKANRAKASARGASYYQANRPKIKAYHADRYKQDPEVFRQRNEAWSRANPESSRTKTENRRARKVASGGRLSKGLAARLYAKQEGLCACCGSPLNDLYHMDHIMPLVLGGSNTDDNIQLLLPRCNMEKGAMHPEEFALLRATNIHQEG